MAAGKNVNPVIAIAKGLISMPKPMVRVCLVQFFAW
jgi:hypothetical protein